MAAKSSTFGAIQSATETIMNVINEIATHKTFCQSFGIGPEELESTPESTATTAYGAYILNVGLQGRLAVHPFHDIKLKGTMDTQATTRNSSWR